MHEHAIHAAAVITAAVVIAAAVRPTVMAGARRRMPGRASRR